MGILGCFKRKKAGLFSLFLQRFVPFSRRADTEDQLKKKKGGGCIFILRESYRQPAQNDGRIQMFAVFEWSHVAPHRSPLLVYQTTYCGAKWGHKCRQKTQLRRGEKTRSYKINPEHEKPTTGKKKKITKKDTNNGTCSYLAEKTWSWRQTDQQWLRGRRGLKYARPDQLIEHRCGGARAGKQTKTVRRHKTQEDRQEQVKPIRRTERFILNNGTD